MRTTAALILCGLGLGCAAARSPRPATSRDGQVVLLPADSHDAALFHDEREQLRTAARSWLAKHGHALVPLEEVDRVAALTREGRRREGGPVCAAPVGFHSTRAEHFPGSVEATVRASCFKHPCRLDLDLSRPPRGEGAWKRLASYEATVPQPTLRGWLDAVEQLTAPTPSGPAGNLVGGLGLRTGPPPPPVELRRVRAWGPWAIAPTVESLKGFEPELARCHQAGWSSGSDDETLLAIGADGRVTRCEGEGGRDPDDDSARFDCMCRAWSTHAFDPGPPDRRLIVRTMNALEPGVVREGLRYGYTFESPSSRSGPLWPKLPARDLPECYAAAGGTGPRTFPVRWEVDEAGYARSATVQGAADGLKACAERALVKARFPCTPTGEPEEVTAVMRLYAYRP